MYNTNKVDFNVISKFRIAAGPSFYLGTGVALTSDLAPPCRISDLRQVGVANLSVSLEWTAPGGDFDFGKGKGFIHSLAYREGGKRGDIPPSPPKNLTF